MLLLLLLLVHISSSLVIEKPGNTGFGTGLVSNKDGPMMFAAFENTGGRVIVYNETKEWIFDGEYNTIAISPDGTLLALSRMPKYQLSSVMVYELVDGQWRQLGNTIWEQTAYPGLHKFGSALSILRHVDGIVFVAISSPAAEYWNPYTAVGVYMMYPSGNWDWLYNVRSQIIGFGINVQLMIQDQTNLLLVYADYEKIIVHNVTSNVDLPKTLKYSYPSSISYDNYTDCLYLEDQVLDLKTSAVSDIPIRLDYKFDVNNKHRLIATNDFDGDFVVRIYSIDNWSLQQTIHTRADYISFTQDHLILANVFRNQITIVPIAPTSYSPTKKPTITKKPTTSKPTTNKPTTKKPTTSKPTTSKPTKKPTTSKPTKKPTTKQLGSG